MKYMVDRDTTKHVANDLSVALDRGPGGMARIVFGFSEDNGGTVMISAGFNGIKCFEEVMSMQEFIDAILLRNSDDQEQ